MPHHYQDRREQLQAIGRARHWLERLEQLAEFEHVVLRTSAIGHDDHKRPVAHRESAQPTQR